MPVPGTAVYNAGVATTPDGAVYVQHTSGATIDSPTFTGTHIGDTYPVGSNSIPLIGLSTGSVAAGGAISGITALPLAYPAAYCWFPANILAASIAAGWYYCTFSSTTAGTAFLNTYTSGVPTIPGTPTPVVAGQGAFTGDTGTETALQITIPANALGANGAIRFSVQIHYTSNANTKTFMLKHSGTGGTAYINNGQSSVGQCEYSALITNTGTGNQVGYVKIQPPGAPAMGASLGTADTTASTTLVTQLQRAVATDNIVQLPAVIELVRLT